MWSLPSLCQICGRWPAQPVCGACVARFAADAPRCRGCALRLAPGADPALPCGACLLHPLPLQRCWAVVDYAFPWHTLVARFKGGQEPAWAGHFAALAWARPEIGQALAQADCTLPIPTTAQRLGRRGYNQAWELVKALRPRQAQATGLLRLAGDEHQTGQNRHQRQRQMRNAFVANPRWAQSWRGAHLLLVDDVMTTGATLGAAAKTLLDAGAARVDGLCFARTPLPDD